MANLSVNYAGLKLRNPFIVSSSGLTSSVERIRKLDDLGVGAVVLKSLFEEQIKYEAGDLLSTADYPEALDYVNRYTKENSVSEYLKLIEDSKKAANMPVISSINCVSASEWTDFALKIEEAGADALELNVYYLPVDKEKEAFQFEKIYYDLVGSIKEKLKIPVIFKIGSNFTNPLYFINQLHYRKADAVVMFNRFYAPDIDIEEMEMVSAEVLSNPGDLRNTLRWIGIVSGQIDKIDIAGSTGIHSGEAAIKVILAGAKAVQVCSALYKNGLDYITEIMDKFEAWMLDNNYKNIEEFRGKMSYKRIKDPAVYERSQFMKYFSNMH